ncbi:predicted protein [Naegleria gruberi]|uniref:Predicted protein n=1 Tax=Naegleria gruberi TaxID=5762 RepID=D2VE91_NAEGR|nr:uncharacterized protein NAEGRDRAFT_48843 [Naegleria gruberi]EFC44755.1 predicted protein [Naegleria gruberi]|eukprot:XP_002677499.1 predicted protein [Naegleria gruberi strain NEG-M]
MKRSFSDSNSSHNDDDEEEDAYNDDESSNKTSEPVLESNRKKKRQESSFVSSPTSSSSESTDGNVEQPSIEVNQLFPYPEDCLPVCRSDNHNNIIIDNDNDESDVASVNNDEELAAIATELIDTDHCVHYNIISINNINNNVADVLPVHGAHLLPCFYSESIQLVDSLFDDDSEVNTARLEEDEEKSFFFHLPIMSKIQIHQMMRIL